MKLNKRKPGKVNVPPEQSQSDIFILEEDEPALQVSDGAAHLEGLAYRHAQQNGVHVQLSLELSWFSRRYKDNIRQLSLELR